MSGGTAAIQALRARVATNTLTASDQGALTTALDFIAPSFGTPDETAAVVFSDEDNAREMMAALYTIVAGGGANLIVPAKVITPNTPETQVTLTPGTGGAILFVIDITPTETGLVLVSCNLAVVAAAPDSVLGALFLVEPLTAITGGTLVAPGLTTHPTSTTPTLTGGTEIFAEADNTEVILTNNTGGLNLASVPIQCPVGVRCGIGLSVASTGSISWTVGMTVSAIEVPIA